MITYYRREGYYIVCKKDEKWYIQFTDGSWSEISKHSHSFEPSEFEGGLLSELEVSWFVTDLMK